MKRRNRYKNLIVGTLVILFSTVFFVDGYQQIEWKKNILFLVGGSIIFLMGVWAIIVSYLGFKEKE